MSDYTVIILVTLVGFTALALLLLVPVYRFLKREERAGNRWTEKHLEVGPASVPDDTDDASTLDASSNGTDART